jgi:5-methyltetrahydropteroyltriglutamate--homocysteine methyltransferase
MCTRFRALEAKSVKRSTDHILTTHVGSLPRPPELRELEQAGRAGSDEYRSALRAGVRDIVEKQLAVRLDVINDGEIYKPSWSGYVRERLKGFEPRPVPEGFSYTNRGREAVEFAGYYAERGGGVGGIGGLLGAPVGGGAPATTQMTCVAPIEYVGQALVQRDVENLREAIKNVQPADVFMAAVGPDNVGYQPGVNQHYASEDDYIRGNAQALIHEYKAVTDAGFILQIDTPVMKFAALQMTLPDFRRRFGALVEILNETLKDIPEEQIRLHICFGGGRGPHSNDIMLKDFMDLVLKIKSTGISIDQNVHHEHEWVIWKDMKLPDGKVLIPGVVAHTTDTIEHPELIAQRLVRYANLVGRENVMAGTDCGLGGRVHAHIAWAKFRAMVEGARLATKELWGK